jgi:hypothetical protein
VRRFGEMHEEGYLQTWQTLMAVRNKPLGGMWRPVVGSILGRRGAQLHKSFSSYCRAEVSHAVCGEDHKAANIAFTSSMSMFCLRFSA